MSKAKAAPIVCVCSTLYLSFTFLKGCSFDVTAIQSAHMCCPKEEATALSKKVQCISHSSILCANGPSMANDKPETSISYCEGCHTVAHFHADILWLENDNGQLSQHVSATLRLKNVQLRILYQRFYCILCGICFSACLKTHKIQEHFSLLFRCSQGCKTLMIS